MADWDDTYQVPTKHNATINTGTSTVDSFADTEARGVVWLFTVDKGSGANMRTGVIRAFWDLVADSSPGMMPVRYSDDIGTVSITFTVDKSGNSVRLRATVSSDSWRVDVTRQLIGAA